MPEHEVELSVGEVIRMGNHILTVIDIDGPNVSFRIEEIPAAEFEQQQLAVRINRPR